MEINNLIKLLFYFLIAISFYFFLPPNSAIAGILPDWTINFSWNDTSIVEGGQYIFPLNTLGTGRYKWSPVLAYGDIYKGELNNAEIIMGHSLGRSGDSFQNDSWPAYGQYFVVIYDVSNIIYTSEIWQIRDWFQKGINFPPEHWGIIRFEIAEIATKWSFAIITDLHIGRGYPDYDGITYNDTGDGEDYYLTERLKKVVNWVSNNKDNIDCGDTKCPIQFLAVLGDITNTAEKSQFLKAKAILDKLNDPSNDGNTNDGIPYVPVFGNHDVWPYTDNEEAASSLGEIYFDGTFWDENATNTKLLKERLNFQKDEENPKYKNFAFSYREMNFIGLDFDSRNHIPSPFIETGVWPEAVLYAETTNWLKDCLINHKECLEGYEGNSNIIFSHHPFVGDLIMGFSFGPSPLPNELEEIREIVENKNVLANFGGHIHGFYDWWREDWRDANEENYSKIGDTSVITTETLMMGSNQTDEYLKEHDKGVIKIVKVLSQNEIDYKTNEGRYKPETGEEKEFVALNPYISFTFTQPTEILPCVFFKAHAFTKRDVSYRWDFGDGTTGNGQWENRCYSSPGFYNVTLTLTDTKTGEKESITQKVEVKEGIIPKFLKVADEMKEKIELISVKLGEDLTKIGQVFKDNVLIKIKHSEAIPIGLITVHFEKATEDIDLTQMIADIDSEIKKSILYMPGWPETIEKNKILFIPK